jgi:hypothetical protein
MGFFDKIKSGTDIGKPFQNEKSNEVKKIVFADIPGNIEAFKSLEQADLSDPFKTAALTVAALCVYPENKELCFEMLDYLKGPSKLSGMDKQFIADRFRDKDYVPRSYFEGAVPSNNYMPSSPYTVCVSSNSYSFLTAGMAKLFIKSGGADSPRPVELRLAKDGKWYLWQQLLLSGIRQPESENPWA